MLARLEHSNITVTDPDATAAELIKLFDWHVRWSGDAIHGGRTVHVGNDDTYLALYSGTEPQAASHTSYNQIGGLNHVGVVVEDLDATEERVRALGYDPHSHADYEPGRRFYFHGADGLEIEVISYTGQTT